MTGNSRLFIEVMPTKRGVKRAMNKEIKEVSCSIWDKGIISENLEHITLCLVPYSGEEIKEHLDENDFPLFKLMIVFNGTNNYEVLHNVSSIVNGSGKETVSGLGKDGIAYISIDKCRLVKSKELIILPPKH